MKLNFQIELSPKDKIKGLNLPTYISEDLAYIVGVLAGDGSIQIRLDKNSYRIKCVGDPHTEKEFYDKILRPLFRNIFNLDIKVKPHDSGTTYGFEIYSKAMVLFLTELFDLPIGKKYIKLRIPKLVREHKLVISFIRGVADTDFCLTYKKKNTYPCISGSSKSKLFLKEIAHELKNIGFKVYELYDYKIMDDRFEKGYSVINSMDLNGKTNLKIWLDKIGFRNPKHLKKIKE